MMFKTHFISALSVVGGILTEILRRVFRSVAKGGDTLRGEAAAVPAVPLPQPLQPVRGRVPGPVRRDHEGPAGLSDSTGAGRRRRQSHIDRFTYEKKPNINSL